MDTRHQIYFEDSRNLATLAPQSVDLVVTSPPYPMIQMWDTQFVARNAEIDQALENGDGRKAFELMHRELDGVWQAVGRVLKPGGIACLNVGDATRRLDGHFRLYPNHSRILQAFLNLGFETLPAILWRKQTNAPTKFMGSGMLPPGAYVTLEHEYILILRKGAKREFKRAAERQNRRESAFFWEERNAWFSDVWMDVKGTAQHLGDRAARLRSAAFPFEVPYRLINMFSVKGDLVLDPFLGIGTTMWAAMASQRNGVGYEIEKGLRPEIHAIADSIVAYANDHITRRIQTHRDYVRQHQGQQGQFKYTHPYYQFAVKTRQEIEMIINRLASIQKNADNGFEVTYSSA